MLQESYGIISSQQKQAFGSIYDEIDKDKNGSVTLEELKQRMRPSVTRHDIKHFLQVRFHSLPQLLSAQGNVGKTWAKPSRLSE